jgi:23S rRNA (uracil1939-C5)-methyltransferase
LRLKTALVTRLVRAALPDAPAALDMIPATPVDQPWGFRQKVQFVFGTAAGGTGRAEMGHYARGSRRVVEVDECPVHDPHGNETAYALRDAVTSPAPAALAGVAVRVGHASTERMTTIVAADERDPIVRAITKRFLRDRPDTSVHLNLHTKRDGYVFGPVTRRLAGTERLREVVEGMSFLISPTAFFQTNVRAAGVLVRLVLDAVPAGGFVLDLYAGAGLFALPLAARGDRVLAVEEHPEAVADGHASLRLNRLDPARCRLVASRAEAFLRSRLARPRRAPDAVVLDPPRSGCSQEVLAGVFGTLEPSRAVYVSCDPIALARDLREIVRHQYQVRSVQPVDMFPHTPYVETVVVLERKTGRRRGREAG